MELAVTRLKVEQVEEEVSSSTLKPDEAWLESLGLGPDVRVEPPLTIDLEMHRLGEDVFVSGHLSGKLVLPCSRCLDPAHAEIDQPFRAVYVRAGGRADGTEIEPGAPSEGLGQEGEAEGPDVFFHVRGWLDLTPMLREQILLAVPARALCGEACPGLCPVCGANLNRARCDCTPQAGVSKFEKLRGLVRK